VSDGLDAGVPFVPAVSPIAAVSTPQACEAVDQLDAYYVLRLLIAELTLDPETQGGAVADAEFPRAKAERTFFIFIFLLVGSFDGRDLPEQPWPRRISER